MKALDAIHVIFAGEKVRLKYLLATPTLDESEAAPDFRVLILEARVRMKITSFHDKDRTHLRDFTDIGTIDESWLTKFPPDLVTRLQELLDTPDG